MIIHSFVKSDFGLRPVRVEVVFTPGVSQIQILGLPDPLIKESSKRILSALRYQGFGIPSGKQVLVNLHPSAVKKTSQGLDLAIAFGILIESGQVDKEFFDFENGYCYGALSLKGEVLVPDELKLLNYEDFEKPLLTGQSDKEWRFDVSELEELSSHHELMIKPANFDLFSAKEHTINENLFFEEKMARLMTIVATGEHPMLIAGSAGCGKTTLIENLGRLLSQPDEKDFLESKKYWMLSGRDLKTRPIVQPHHSATPVSMIGGGSSLRFGEISLAHGGALLLDELLEFHPQVQSALREPMEKGVIYISRAGRRCTFPAKSLILATTNLCHCGHFKPGESFACRCSSLKLRNYMERLTGPFLDRFSVFHLYQKPKVDLKVGLAQIKGDVERACRFRLSERKQKIPNQDLVLAELMAQLPEDFQAEMIPVSKSMRRRLSLLRVARTLADMENSLKIKQHHLEEAQRWTSSDIYRLERFRVDDFAMR